MIRLSKRRFLKLGMGGTLAMFVAPLLRVPSLLGGPLVLPSTFLESGVHRRWMKLSYNGGFESRDARRRLGAVLRNVGSVRGQGRGYEFAGVFDQALNTVFVGWSTGAPKPKSLFELINRMYRESILPRHGELQGRVLFGTLFSVLRGRDGSQQGESAHRAYLSYRNALLDYKNAYRSGAGEGQVEGARMAKAQELGAWRQQLQALVDVYASGGAELDGRFRVEASMLDGIEVSVVAVRVTAPRLSVVHAADQVVISWDGNARLESAPTVQGPWTVVDAASPVVIAPEEKMAVFRNVQE